MAYRRDTLESIETAIAWELANFDGKVRVGLNADVGPDATWTTLDEMIGMAGQSESAHAAANTATDIHSFSRLAQSNNSKISVLHRDTGITCNLSFCLFNKGEMLIILSQMRNFLNLILTQGCLD